MSSAVPKSSGAPGPSALPEPDATPSETELALWAPVQVGEKRKPDVLEALREVPLFQGLSTGELKKLSRLLHARTYQAGEVIFREGDPGAGMYLVQQGEVAIVIRLADGTERQLACLSERQFFGEMALLEDAPRSASAVARVRTELLGFFEPDLEGLIERDSRLGSRVLWNLARLMASRLRASNAAQRGGRGGTR